MEVIAKKNGSYIAPTVILFIFGIAGLAGFILCIVFLSAEERHISFLALIFAFVCIPGGIYYSTVIKLPNNLIMFDGQKLILYNKREIMLGEIENITYTHAHTRLGPCKHGKINLALKSGENIEVNHVGDLDATTTRLSKLIYGNSKSYHGTKRKRSGK